MKTYLEPKDVEAMEQVASCLRDKLLIRLSFYLGCRISEALALTVDDIDIEKETVTILHLKTRSRITCPDCGTRLSKSHTFCPACGIKIDQAVIKKMEQRRHRTLPIDGTTLAMLKDYISRGGTVFKNDKKYLLGVNRHRGWQVIKNCAEKAGLTVLTNPETGRTRGISPHRLRDAFAIHAMKLDDSGDGLRLLQEHLGHASFNTTAKYRKIAGEEHREWYDNLWRKESDGATS